MNNLKFLIISALGLLVLASFVLTIDRSMSIFASEDDSRQPVVTTSLNKVVAQTQTPVSHADGSDYEALKQKLSYALQLEVNAITDSPVSGLLHVMTERGLFYVSQDGTYFLQANVYNLEQGMRNETQVALAGARIAGLEAFAQDTIEFKAENEKYVVNIFTDISCGYCRKLHNEMQDYNDLGITVRYLAFPRQGLNSPNYYDMVSVWCADDPQKAMTEAKNGASVPDKSCETKVAQQYQFGQSMGVTGTPNIVMPNGMVVPGYQPAAQLEQALKNMM
jgi:thiol:disulfide interchange protein DsbC